MDSVRVWLPCSALPDGHFVITIVKRDWSGPWGDVVPTRRCACCGEQRPVFLFVDGCELRTLNKQRTLFLLSSARECAGCRTQSVEGKSFGLALLDRVGGQGLDFPLYLGPRGKVHMRFSTLATDGGSPARFWDFRDREEITVEEKEMRRMGKKGKGQNQLRLQPNRDRGPGA